MNVYTTQLAQEVIGCAIEVHTEVGPGLLESMYQRCFSRELGLRGLSFKEQVALPLTYKGLAIGIGYRVDFVVENELVVELKTVEKLLPQHCSQVLTYLRLLDLPQGFLMNFSVGRMADGIKSILNPRASRASNQT